jgi:hypothetical protein
VFTRDNCGLCRQAEELVAELAMGQTEVTLVDVDSDDDLLRRYHLRVPVIEVDGVEVAAAPIDSAAVRAALGRGRGFWSRRPRS